MKRNILKAMVLILSLLLIFTALAGCAGQGEQDPAGPQGQKGETGAQGEKGDTGAAGENGKSAYELACDNGYSGTESEWLASLVGKDGKDGESGTDGRNGQSAYEIAVSRGYRGTVVQSHSGSRRSSVKRALRARTARTEKTANLHMNLPAPAAIRERLRNGLTLSSEQRAKPEQKEKKVIRAMSVTQAQRVPRENPHMSLPATTVLKER